jgi:kumamolisin
LADPETGWLIVVDGQSMVIGGTSAVAPLMAAVSVALSQASGRKLGTLDFLSAAYTNGSAFWPIVSGNNGMYVAGPGWDACTGQGVVLFGKMLAAMNPAPAPAPQPTPAPVPVPAGKTRTIVVLGAESMTVDGVSV